MNSKIKARELDSCFKGVIGKKSSTDAVSLKDKGNELYRCGKYQEAIAAYTASIDAQKTSLAFANRAMAALKLARFDQAEHDCTEALKLDPTYAKAFQRRATARKELGDYRGAAEDFESVVLLEPTHKEAAIGRKECLSRIYNVPHKVEKLQVHVSSKAKDFLIQEKIMRKIEVQQPQALQKARIVEVVDEEAVPDVFDEPNPTAIKGMSDNRDPKKQPKTVVKTEKSTLPVKKHPPRTGIEFERDWRSFCGDIMRQSNYLLQLEPGALPNLLKQALNPPLLFSIIQTLLAASLNENSRAALQLLEALPSIPRFELNFLSMPKRAELSRLWETAKMQHTGLNYLNYKF